MTKLRQMLTILPMLISISGCAVLQGNNWVQPICVSKDDILTTGTKQQIVTHDETLGKPCK